MGPQQGRKVFTLQTLPDESDSLSSSTVGETAGFSLHAGVATKANERAKLERLCRYITRPAVSTKRLSLTHNGRVRYELKTPWHNGTTHVIFEPLDIEICDKCGGDVRIFASIEDPAVISKILTRLNEKAVHTDLLPQCRAPPGTGFLPEAQRFAGRDRGRAGL
jgi:hypothetical protein